MPVLTKSRPITNKLARALFVQGFLTESRDLLWPQFCQEVDSYSETEYFATLGTAPQVELIDDSIPSDLKEWVDYSFTYTNKTFRAAAEIKENLVVYDQTGQVKTIPGSMAARVVNFPDKRFFQNLRNGTSATLGKCIFGGAFFQASHAVGGEGPATQSNLVSGSTTTALFASTSKFRDDIAQLIQNDFDNALVQLISWLDDRGEPVYERIDPEQLVVLCSPLAHTAIKLALGGRYIKQTENIFAGAVNRIYMSTYLPTTGAEAADWYLVYLGAKMRPMMFSRFRIKSDAEMQDKIGGQDIGEYASKLGISTAAFKNFMNTQLVTNLGKPDDSDVIRNHRYLIEATFRGEVTYGDPRTIIKVDNAAS